MIFIHLSNLLTQRNFSGIVRTEYELCRYALDHAPDIAFSAFDRTQGFVRVDKTELLTRMQKFKDGTLMTGPRPNIAQRLKNSTLKRFTTIKQKMGVINHPFGDGDVIISVGQEVGSGEMTGFNLIKQRTDITLKVLVHDLIPLNSPQFVTDEHYHRFIKWLNELTAVSGHFYANSQHTQRELLAYHAQKGLPMPHTRVLTLGCDIHTKSSAPLPDELIKAITMPYVLFVSTIEVRKNHQVIYDAYIELIDKGIAVPLMIFVGRRGWKVDELLNKLDTDPRILGKIIIADKVSDGQLVALYQNAWFTVYPSLMEGYGLPVAESLAFGKYCLASNAGALPEAGGDLIDYLDPHDTHAWAQKIAYLNQNPDYIAGKCADIKARYAPTPWQNFAKTVIDEALNARSPTIS